MAEESQVCDTASKRFETQPDEYYGEKIESEDDHRRLPPLIKGVRYSTVRSTAPRLFSITASALRPRVSRRPRFVRSSSKEVTSCPTICFSLSFGSWIRASLERKLSTAAAKFVVLCPVTIARPAAAGSKMLCPPCGMRLPPTKTISANGYAA